VNYAARFLIGMYPTAHWRRLLSRRRLGIFVSGCNKISTTGPCTGVEVATVRTRDVPVYSEWVATVDGY